MAEPKEQKASASVADNAKRDYRVAHGRLVVDLSGKRTEVRRGAIVSLTDAEAKLAGDAVEPTR